MSWKLSRTTQQRLLKIGGAMLAAVIILAVGAEWLLRTDWFAAQLRVRIQLEAENVLGPGVVIGGVDFDPASLRVEIRDFSSPPQDRLGGRPLLAAPLIRLGLSWESFLRGPLHLRSVVVESPRVTIVSDEEGLHLPVLPEAAGGRVALAVERLEALNGRLDWNARQWDLDIQAEDLDALTRRPPEGCYETRFTGGRIAYTFQGRPGEIESVHARTSLCGRDLTIAEAQISSAGAVLSADGSAKLSEAPYADLAFRIDGPLTAFAAVLPSEWTVGGRVDVDGSLAWRSNLGSFEYQGRARARDLSVAAAGLRADQAMLEADIQGSLDRFQLSALQVEALGGVLRGEAAVTDLGSPAPYYRFSGEMEGLGLRALLSAAGLSARSVIWDAATSAGLEAEGRSLSDLQVSATLRLNGSGAAGTARPVSGEVEMRFDGASQTLRADSLSLRTADTTLNGSGTVVGGFSTVADVQLDASEPDDLLRLLALLGLNLQTAPFELLGPVAFSGPVRAETRNGSLTVGLEGDVSTGRIRLLGYEWSRAQGALRIDPAGFEIADAVLEDGRGRAQLSLKGNAPAESGWRWEDLPLHGVLEADGLNLAKTLVLTGSDAPLTGSWGGRVEVVGQLKDLRLIARINVDDAVLADEPIDRIELAAYVGRELALIEDLLVRDGSGSVRGAGRYAPSERRFELDLEGRGWLLEEMDRFRRAEHTPAGKGSFDVRASGRLTPGGGSLESLQADGSWSLDELVWRGAELGRWQGRLGGSGDQLQMDWAGSILGGELTGTATVDWPGRRLRGAGRLRNVDPAAVALLTDVGLENLSGAISGEMEISADLSDPAGSFQSEGAFGDVELRLASIIGSDLSYQLYNPFPMRWSFKNRILSLEHMRLQGEGSDFEVDGDIAFGNATVLDLRLEGELNLAALSALGGDISAEGRSTIEVSVQGEPGSPEVSGMLRVRGASLRSEDFSNGLTGVEGEVALDGRRVRIRELSGLTGGGRVTLSGFSELGGEGAETRLRAEVSRVRIRYPAEVSSIVDGRLVLTGNDRQALLSGELTVLRAATDPTVSLGALIGSLKQPAELQPGNRLLRNLQLNVHVVSAPDLTVETSVVRDIEAVIDLRAVGAFGSPSLLGSVTVSRGQINFHGSRYRINRGEIAFVNPFRIEPVLDFEFETRIRDINIGLILSGPARRMNVSYRSDPPLSFADLVNLVAVGRSPITDPVLSSQQRVQQQSLFQTGANNVFNQAVERPVSPGLQRLFGVSRLKVDPQAGGAEANPAARISTEQQITDEITLIYTYDLASAQQQTFRLEYTPNRRWMFVLTRDQNGLVGSDVLYRARLR
jgi:translocation and assembly module TamB